MYPAQFCLLEQIFPHGPNHPFAQTMLNHFNKLKTPLKSVALYPTAQSQRSRFLNRGWHQADTWDLWEFWSSDYFLTPLERMALDDIEPFDEWEELMLFARHHLIVHARAHPYGTRASGQAKLCHEPAMEPYLESTVTYQGETKPSKRRFGGAMTVSNPMGHQFAVHILGMGINGRADTYDVYALGQFDMPPRLPLSGPLPRMYHTVTDIGDFGILLVGGRGLPGSAMSDCWIFRKGVDCCWQATWRLPTPLFRHSTLRLKGSALALVFGGKMEDFRLSDHCFVFHPVMGWLRCEIQGTHPDAAFGTVLCNSSEPSNELGIFRGLLAGGMGKDGQVITRKYLWRLDTNPSQVWFT